MNSLLSQAAQKFPTEVALVTPHGRLTYRDYYRLVLKAAANLDRSGLERGDTLALIAENRLETIILLMALWEVGAVAVPLSPRLPIEQIGRILRYINCPRLVVPRAGGFDPVCYRTLLIANNANERMTPIFYKDFKKYSINSRYPRYPRAKFLRDKIFVSVKKCPVVNDPVEELNTFFFDKFVDQRAAGLPDDPPPREFSLDQPATILLTSGTTKLPKAVLHSIGNHYFSALGSNQNIPFKPGDRWLLSLPLYHVGGLAILVRALLGGAAVVVAGVKEPLPDTLHRVEISHLSLVPTQLYRVLQEAELGPTLQKLKAILLGGSDIPPALIQETVRQGLPIHTTYGSTEMSSQITTTRPGESTAKLLTAGRLLNYRDLKIASDGEILLRGKTLFTGYLAAGGRIEQPFDAAGWFASGDMGWLDAEGYLVVRGRKDNMFISGGENICPEEIEAHLKQMPGIMNALVVPVKNAEFGARPVVFVQTEGQDFDEADVKRHLEKELPRFKIPDRFFSWPPLVLPDTLKYNRKDFMALAEEKMHSRA